jgi:ubiquinone/menaquinone biosynthesis C-methylase UbiE
MNYEAVEETIKAGYREVSSQYRHDDEIEVTTPNHHRICATLQRICVSFPHPVKVLDLGCGTGRYFHCLTNVEELTGMDISDEMLQEAETNPVRQEMISVKKIELIRGNVYLRTFPSESFHFIYSLGMFGNGCPVTVELCNRFYDWLTPGGKLYFNTVDFAGLPLWYRARRQARDLVYPILSRRWKNVLDERESRQPWFSMTRDNLEDVMRKTRFTTFQVASHVCQSPLWSGRHLECIASKGIEGGAEPAR